MCGRAGAPQFGQFTVAAAVAFQFARRECVLAREVLYFRQCHLSILYFVRTMSLSVRYLNARLVQTSFRRASLGLLAVLLGLELGFEPCQSGKTDIRHIVMMVG